MDHMAMEKGEDAKLEVLSDLLEKATEMLLEMKGDQGTEEQALASEKMPSEDDAEMPVEKKVEVEVSAEPMDEEMGSEEEGDPLLKFMEEAGKPKGSAKVGSMMKAGSMPMAKKKLSEKI